MAERYRQHLSEQKSGETHTGARIGASIKTSLGENLKSWIQRGKVRTDHTELSNS